MNYTDQLVLTGAINSVGEAIRTNAPSSYRLGIEASLNMQLSAALSWQVNSTISRNRIQDFTEKLVEYADYSIVSIKHGETNIAYSPSVIAGSSLTYSHAKVEVSLLSKYVGQQYLDNTSNAGRALPAYFTQDVRLGYGLTKKIRATVLLNNVLNSLYSSNGYTFSYLYDGALTTENFHYPQAGFNFLVGLSIRL
jgi:iron complex outermembrane receptor protein